MFTPASSGIGVLGKWDTVASQSRSARKIYAKYLCLSFRQVNLIHNYLMGCKALSYTRGQESGKSIVSPPYQNSRPTQRAPDGWGFCGFFKHFSLDSPPGQVGLEFILLPSRVHARPPAIIP